jgi:surface polysaccharide O-acyltransferase-like enzyme
MGELKISYSPINVVAVEKRNSLSFLQTMFELYRQDRVVLPLDPAALVTSPGLHIVERLDCGAGSGWFWERHAPRHDRAIAQISMTSGTTGASKPMALSHLALGDVTNRLIEIMGLDDTIAEYVGVPVTFSFGFGRVRAIAAVGGRSFLPSRNFRVDEFAAMLDRGEVNSLSAVPSLLRVVLAQQDRLRSIGAKLRWLEIGSQAMSRQEKEAVRDLFPNACIVQHYGLTEASRSTFLRISSESGAALASVGKPIGEVEVKITAEGRIAVRGPHVADGIVTASGIEPITGKDGWLVTSDLGHFDDGWLHFDGRADHLVNVGGIKIPAEAFEEKLLARLEPGADVACAAGKDDLRGEIVVVAHRPIDSGGDGGGDVDVLRKAAGDVAEEMSIRDGFALLPMAAIPRTETNKVRRHEIGAAYDAWRRTAPESGRAGAGAGGDPGGSVRDEFVILFGDRVKSGSQSFAALGGDSLQYVVMMLALERHIPQLPEGWDARSIDDLSALAQRQTQSGLKQRAGHLVPDNLNSVRGLACVMIVALHVVGVKADEGLRLPLESLWHVVMDTFTPIRLPLFTALSGFLYAAMPATREGFPTFARRKLQQLLIPLIFATLVFWSLRQIVFDRHDSLFWAFVDGYQHLWFIDALLMIFLVVGIIDTQIRSRLAIWWALIAAVVVIYPFVPDVRLLHLKNALFLLPFFAFGILLYRTPGLLRNPWLAGASVVALPVLLAAQFMPIGVGAMINVDLMLRWLCGAVAVVAFLRFFPRIGWLEMLAVYSFTIYLWHPAVNGLVRTVAWRMGIENVPFLFSIGLASAVLLPVVLHRIMLRLPRISMLFIGR